MLSRKLMNILVVPALKLTDARWYSRKVAELALNNHSLSHLNTEPSPFLFDIMPFRSRINRLQLLLFLKHTCIKHVAVPEICLSSSKLEFVSTYTGYESFIYFVRCSSAIHRRKSKLYIPMHCIIWVYVFRFDFALFFLAYIDRNSSGCVVSFRSNASPNQKISELSPLIFVFC